MVIVNGPTAATQFTAAERTKIVAEVQAGAGWLAGFNRWAGVSFSYDVRNVSIATQPNATATDNESRFRDPAVAALGFQANWNGVSDYVNWLRADRHTNWGYCVFFVKGYPVDHFAYASIGGPRIVMEYANDGWGPDNIDRVFAHESGHIFGAPDEYASSGCNCGGSWGRFGEPNSNCENCAGAAGVGCLMRANEWLMCGATKRHLGWGLTSLRTHQPGIVQRRQPQHRPPRRLRHRQRRQHVHGRVGAGDGVLVGGLVEPARGPRGTGCAGHRGVEAGRLPRRVRRRHRRPRLHVRVDAVAGLARLVAGRQRGLPPGRDDQRGLAQPGPPRHLRRPMPPAAC